MLLRLGRSRPRLTPSRPRGRMDGAGQWGEGSERGVANISALLRHVLVVFWKGRDAAAQMVLPLPRSRYGRIVGWYREEVATP